jgi:hypothetical protein
VYLLSQVLVWYFDEGNCSEAKGYCSLNRQSYSSLKGVHQEAARKKYYFSYHIQHIWIVKSFDCIVGLTLYCNLFEFRLNVLDLEHMLALLFLYKQASGIKEWHIICWNYWWTPAWCPRRGIQLQSVPEKCEYVTQRWQFMHVYMKARPCKVMHMPAKSLSELHLVFSGITPIFALLCSRWLPLS